MERVGDQPGADQHDRRQAGGSKRPARNSPMGRHRPLPQAYHALRQLLDAAARRDVAAAERPVHVLPAPTTRIVNPIDFRDTAQLIDNGYRLAADWLAINATQTTRARDRAAGHPTARRRTSSAPAEKLT